MTNWTTELKLEHLMALPWTVLIEQEDGELVGRVRELQGVLAVGENERLLQIDLAESLESVLAVMLESGDPIPTPAGCVLPWNAGEAPGVTPRLLARLSINREAWMDIRAKSSATVRTVHA